MTEVAEAFNQANITAGGKPISVKIRNIASGTATDYIKSGKYVPDAFTPSNELWGEMVETSSEDEAHLEAARWQCARHRHLQSQI